MRVKLYRNLSTKYRASAKRAGYVTWSLLNATGPRAGYVHALVDAAVLKDVDFVVGEKGRQRVLRLRKKNPHAFAVGDVVRTWPLETVTRGLGPEEFASAKMVRVGYDPYTLKTFIREDCGEPVHGAQLVVATPTGVFAKLPPCKGKRGLRGLEGMTFEVDPFDSANWYG